MKICTFVFDPDKSAANLVKLKIDFGQAQALWNDDDRLVIMSVTPGEVRWMMIGRISE